MKSKVGIFDFQWFQKLFYYQANELNSLIEEMLSLVGGTDISKMEIKRILEENNFQKERVVEVILEKRGQKFQFISQKRVYP